MKITPNTDSRAWLRADADSVATKEGGIDHGASAVQNLRSMGEDILHAVVPFDRPITMMWSFNKVIPVIGGFFGLLCGIFLDVLEIAILPLELLKNLGDIIAHGIAAAIDHARGRSPGTPVAIPKFDYSDYPTFIRDIDAAVNEQPEGRYLDDPAPQAPPGSGWGALKQPETSGVRIRRGSRP